MKQWFLEYFLPMWAKETVLRENRRLRRENHILQEKNAQQRSYIQGLHKGLRWGGKNEAS